MKSLSRRTILLVVLITLLLATGVWGYVTYQPGNAQVARSTAVQEGWRVLQVVGFGLLAGWISRRSLLSRQEPPGGVWTMLAAGVFGAWLGRLIPHYVDLSWPSMEIWGSGIVAFGMAIGVGKITCVCQKRGR